MSRRPRLGERLYRVLLRCYPGEFRDEYEREMLLAFRERLADDRRGGWKPVARLWWQVLVDSLLRAPQEHLDVLRQDLRYALRSLRRAPAFALTAIATLALGAGASTAMFSLVHAVVLRPLPFDPDNRLIRIWEDNPALSITGFSVSLPNFASWRERSTTMELAAWRGGSATLRAAGDPIRVPSAMTTAGLFRMIGSTPLHGRLFTADDEALNAPPVAVVSESLWRRYLAADPAVVGQPLMVGSTAHTVVGVLPGVDVLQDAELFTPLRIDLSSEDRGNRVAQVMGRRHPGVTFERARRESEAIAAQLAIEYPDSNRGWGTTLSTVYDWIVPPEMRRALYALLGAVLCLLLIACANVAGLMLARAAARRRELAVRAAIGAARRRLVRQVLTEGLVLAALGGAAGVFLAWWMLPLLQTWLPDGLARAGEAVINTPVLLFSIAMCVITGLLFAMLPAFTTAGAHLTELLKQGARGSQGGATRWRHALAGGQVALATLLLVGGGLLIQSFYRLQHVQLGFDPSDLTTARLGLPGDRYDGPETSWGFYRRLLEHLASSPGVAAAAVTSGAPFDGGNTGMPIEAVGPSRLEGKPLQADWRMVSPGYFRALRIPLLRGELFTGNTAADAASMIVSETMARRIWGEDDPLGRQIQAGPAGAFTIVGVVGDVRNVALARDPAPTMYISTARFVWPAMTLVVRSAGGRTSVAPMIRSTVRELDPQLAVYDINTTVDRLANSAAQPRFNASLVVLFAASAATLAAIGIYGVLAYMVSQRQQEIGIRMALGAERSAVQQIFVRQGLRLGVVGTVVGIASALLVSRWIESMMFGVSARDPLTFAAAAIVALLVALLASYLPARRATQVDPLAALRQD